MRSLATPSFRRKYTMRLPLYYSAVLLVVLLLAHGCRTSENSASHGSASARLKPITNSGQLGRTEVVYVPVYSSIHWGIDRTNDLVDLAITLSIRNVSQRYPVV